MSHASSSDAFMGEPAWEIAHLFPNQETWSEDEYLMLNSNRLVELSNGKVDVLPMPTQEHQAIVFFLSRMLFAFVQPAKLGSVLIARLRMKLWRGKFREPDVMFMLSENDHRRGNEFWKGADLVMEVVSPDDPRDKTVVVLTLPKEKKTYAEAGQYIAGQRAESVLLPGFGVDAEEVFSQS